LPSNPWEWLFGWAFVFQQFSVRSSRFPAQMVTLVSFPAA
jgi:hypothetical protein